MFHVKQLNDRGGGSKTDATRPKGHRLQVFSLHPGRAEHTARASNYVEGIRQERLGGPAGTAGVSLASASEKPTH